MKNIKPDNQLLVSTSLRIVAIILVLPYLYIGFKEVISPIGIDVTYGIPLIHKEGFQYLRVVGARNIVLGLLGVFFAIKRQRTIMVVYFMAIALMAAMDCYIVSSAVGYSNEAIKHTFFIVLMSSMAVWTTYSSGQKTENNL